MRCGFAAGNPRRRPRHRLHDPQSRAAQRRLQVGVPQGARRSRDAGELCAVGKAVKAASDHAAQARLKQFTQAGQAPCPMTGTWRLIVLRGRDNKRSHSSGIQPERTEIHIPPLAFLRVWNSPLMWRRFSFALLLMAGLMPAGVANAAPDLTQLAQAQGAPAAEPTANSRSACDASPCNACAGSRRARRRCRAGRADRQRRDRHRQGDGDARRQDDSAQGEGRHLPQRRGADRGEIRRSASPSATAPPSTSRPTRRSPSTPLSMRTAASRMPACSTSPRARWPLSPRRSPRPAT